jgi:hypothetical protein
LSFQNDHNPDAVLDFSRIERTGLDEAVFCARKTPEQIAGILERFSERQQACLLTRLELEKQAQLPPQWRDQLDYDPLSRTAIYGEPNLNPFPWQVAIVSGGTSDAPVCAEAARTLGYYGVTSRQFQDVGVTGLWRLLDRIEEIRSYPIVIAVAGMEGAIFSVLGGLVDAVLIALPTSVSYGVGSEGELALHAALGSCAPGILTVNIDNGYGAACAAIRIMNQWKR